jgi:hypothetical protein
MARSINYSFSMVVQSLLDMLLYRLHSYYSPFKFNKV